MVFLDCEPDTRPTINQVVVKSKALSNQVINEAILSEHNFNIVLDEIVGLHSKVEETKENKRIFLGTSRIVM